MVESSTFGSGFVAMRIATELLILLRYKLRMFGVPLTGHSNVFCDNEVVYKNCSNPESQLKKKHQQICYHKVRNSAAAGILIVFKESTDTNLVDILTKSLPSDKRKFFRQRIMISAECNDSHKITNS